MCKAFSTGIKVLNLSLAVVLLFAIASNAFSQQVSQTLSFDQIKDILRAELLDRIVGLDSRNTHFFILVDVSGSTRQISTKFREMYNYLCEYFFDNGDKVITFGYAQYLKIPSSRLTTRSEHNQYPNLKWVDESTLSGLTITCERTKGKEAVMGAFPTSLEPFEIATDVDLPVYNVLKYITRARLKQKEFIVVIRFADRAGSDFGEPGQLLPIIALFPYGQDTLREEYRNFKCLLNKDVIGNPRELHLGPFFITDINKNLFISVWYSDNFDRFPSSPERINRERGPTYAGGLRRVTYKPEKDRITFSWFSVPKVIRYALYISNNQDALREALAQCKATSSTKRIEIKDAVPDSKMKNILTKTFSRDEIEKGGEVNTKERIFYTIQVVLPIGEQKTERVREVTLPRPPGLKLRDILLVIELILLVLLGLAYLFKPRTFHTARQGLFTWHILTGGKGIPIKSVSKGVEEYENDVIKVRATQSNPNLFERELGKLIAQPRWLPGRFRNKLLLEKSHGIEASIEGSADLFLRQGDKNEIRFIVKDANNALIPLSLEVEHYLRNFRGTIITVGTLSILTIINTICLIIALI